MPNVTCQNCGQASSDVARICRYCGAQLPHAAQQQRTDYAEPRQGSYVPPHSWKSGALPQASAPAPMAQAQPAAAPPSSHGFRCPFCGSDAPPMIARRISTGGWIVFAALLLFCFPLFFIGLLIKEEYRACSWCRSPLT